MNRNAEASFNKLEMQLLEKQNNNTCEKTVFDTLKEARRRANEINVENKAKKDKTRMRGYQCEKCKKFHLTSMSHTTHKFFTDKIFKKKKKFQSFLRKETEYWEDRLNVK